MWKLTFLLSVLMLSSASFGQVIDAGSYIKKNGFMKKIAAGSGMFYTTVKQVNVEQVPLYMEAIKSMPQTEEADRLCYQQSIGVEKQFISEGRNDLKLNSSFGYGGPVDGKIACVFFIEHQGAIAASQVYFLKIVSRGKSYDTFTVIVTH